MLSSKLLKVLESRTPDGELKDLSLGAQQDLPILSFPTSTTPANVSFEEDPDNTGTASDLPGSQQFAVDREPTPARGIRNVPEDIDLLKGCDVNAQFGVASSLGSWQDDDFWTRDSACITSPSKVITPRKVATRTSSATGQSGANASPDQANEAEVSIKTNEQALVVFVCHLKYET